MTTRAADTVVDDELVEAFRRDGFVVVPDLLTADELARYEPLVSEAVAPRTAGDLPPVPDPATTGG